MNKLVIKDSWVFDKHNVPNYSKFECIGIKIDNKMRVEYNALLFIFSLTVFLVCLSLAVTGSILFISIPFSVISGLLTCISFSDACSNYPYSLYQRRGVKIDNIIKNKKRKKLLKKSSVPLVGAGYKNSVDLSPYIEYRENILRQDKEIVEFEIIACLYTYGDTFGWQKDKKLRKTFICDTTKLDWMENVVNLKQEFKAQVESKLLKSHHKNDNAEVLLEILSQS